MPSDSNGEKYTNEWYKRRYGKANKIYLSLNSFKAHSNPLILDVGCHEGDMEKVFAKFTQNFVIGIDISYNSLKKAKSKINQKNKIEFIQASAKALPIRKSKIDWIICNYVIDYLKLEDRERVIKEFELILKNEGLVYLSVGNNLFLKLYKIFPPLFTPIIGKYFGRQHTDSKSFINPMNYEFWKNDVLENKDLEITDVTLDALLDTVGSKFEQNNYFVKIVKKITKYTYKIFFKLSPTWIFILKHKEKNLKST